MPGLSEYTLQRIFMSSTDSVVAHQRDLYPRYLRWLAENRERIEDTYTGSDSVSDIVARLHMPIEEPLPVEPQTPDPPAGAAGEYGLESAYPTLPVTNPDGYGSALSSDSISRLIEWRERERDRQPRLNNSIRENIIFDDVPSPPDLESEGNDVRAACQYCGRSTNVKLFKAKNALACLNCFNPVRYYNTDVVRDKNLRLDSKKQLFGEELELMFGATSDTRKQNVAAELMEQVDSMGLIKHDGSIESGFEIVSVPVPLDKIVAQWSPVFERLNTRKIANFVASKNCGMHVHTSKSVLSLKDQRNLLVFFSKSHNKRFIEMLGGRELNRYCDQPSNQSLLNNGRFNEFHGAYFNKKYMPVATHKERTVEFRFFRATKKKELFFANVETVASFTEFARLTDSGNMVYSKYTDWLLYNKNTYIDKFPHLYELRGKELAKWL